MLLRTFCEQYCKKRDNEAKYNTAGLYVFNISFIRNKTSYNYFDNGIHQSLTIDDTDFVTEFKKKRPDTKGFDLSIDFESNRIYITNEKVRLIVKMKTLKNLLIRAQDADKKEIVVQDKLTSYK